MHAHVSGRPDVDLLFGRIRATGLCDRRSAGIPIGAYLALHLCDKARDEGRPSPRTVTRRVLSEFAAWHEAPSPGPGVKTPPPPKLMRHMTNLPSSCGDIWTTPAGPYRIDHASESLIPFPSARHDRLVANARGWLRSELAAAGIPDGPVIDIEFETTRHGRGTVDGVEMETDGIVGGSPEQKRRAVRTLVEHLSIARSERALANSADMEAMARSVMIVRKTPDLLVRVRPGSVRSPFPNEGGDASVGWYAMDLRGLGEDLLPREWSIVASPRDDGLGENGLEAIRTERRNQKALSTGPTVETALLAEIGMDAVRDLYATVSAWQRERRLNFRGRTTMPTSALPERFPRHLDHVQLKAGELSAAIRLAKGVRWSSGTLVIRGVQLPLSVAMALPGMPLSTVIDHPSVPGDATILRVDRRDGDYHVRAKAAMVAISGGNPAKGKNDDG